MTGEELRYRILKFLRDRESINSEVPDIEDIATATGATEDNVLGSTRHS